VSFLGEFGSSQIKTRVPLVNVLLTIFGKVTSSELHFAVRLGDLKMKKQTRGFWGWLLGEGWSNGGVGG
jgi:hypothetical protein